MPTERRKGDYLAEILPIRLRRRRIILSIDGYHHFSFTCPTCKTVNRLEPALLLLSQLREKYGSPYKFLATCGTQTNDERVF